MSDWIGMAAGPRGPRPEVKARILARAFAARGLRRWRLAAAAGILVALAASGLVWRRVNRLEARLAASRDTLDLMRQPGGRVLSISVTVGSMTASVTVFADTSSRRLLVTCHDLPANAPGQTYQLWFVTERGMRSAGLMTMDEDYPMVMTLDVPRQDGAVTGLAMSVEPRSGSEEPQGPMLFHVGL